MKKPSKKVIGIIIITASLMLSLIGKDVVENKKANSASDKNVEGTKIVADGPVKSIEDFFLGQAEKERSALENLPSPKTLSESVFVSLLGNYEGLKAQSLNTPENLDKLTTQLAEETVSATKIPNRYSMINLQTFPDYRKEDVRNYGNEFAQTMAYYKTIFDSVDSEDDLEFIKLYSNVFVEYGDALAKIEVPRSISNYHLDYINNLYKISVSLVKIVTIEEDPVLLSVITNQYDIIREMQPEILYNISNLFKLNDIIFSDEEPGAMWNNF